MTAADAPGPATGRATADPDVDPPDGGADTGAAAQGQQDGSSRRGLVGRNIAVLLGSQAITWALALILTIAEPRFLGPDGIGQLRLGFSIWAMVNVFAQLGTSTYLTLQFARDPVGATALLRPVVRLRAAAEILATAAVIVFILVADYDRTTRIVILVVGVSLAVTMFAEVARASLYGLQKIPDTARADVITKVVSVTLLITVMVLGGEAAAVAAAMIVPAGLAATLLWRALRRQRPTVPVTPERELVVMRSSSPYWLAGAVTIVYGAIDIVVLSLLASPDEVGWYAAATALYGSLLFIPTAIMTSLFPALAQLHHERPHEVLGLLARTVRSLILVAVPIGAGTIVVADNVTSTVLGEDFQPAGQVLALFGVVAVFMFQSVLFGQFAFATGRHHFFIVIMTIVTLATVPLDLLLVPWTRRTFDNGALGGAISYCLTEFVIVSASIWKLAPQLFDRWTIERLAKCTLAAGALVAASWPLRDRFLPLPVAAGALAYLVALVLLRVPSDEEIGLLRRLAQRVQGRLGRARQAAGEGV